MPSRVCEDCSKVVRSEDFNAHRQAHRDQAKERKGQHRDFRRVRPDILERDDYTCQECGVMAGELDADGDPIRLEVHHIDGDWKNNAPENLETRCFNCNPRGPTAV